MTLHELWTLAYQEFSSMWDIALHDGSFGLANIILLVFIILFIIVIFRSCITLARLFIDWIRNTINGG